MFVPALSRWRGELFDALPSSNSISNGNIMKIRGVPLTALPKLLLRSRARFDCIRHVYLSVCDHYEPAFGRPSRAVEEARVERWVTDYPKVAGGLADSDGRCPQHTFFYPIEDAEYDDRHIARLAGLCRAGYGDVEVHLHHQGETSNQLRELIELRVRRLYDEHGLLAKDASGRITYGFIHGNWALDNSRPDGLWCGVNDELTILRETGCYADFTLPAAPSPCQTTTINSIYYAIDDPRRPNSHDRGVPARVGKQPPDDGLLLIQGPLSFDFGNRKWGLLPRVENGELSGRNRAPTMRRFQQWLRAGVCVPGREDWIFIKTYTHGAQEHTMEMFLGEPMRQFHLGLREFAQQRPALKYYYVTARETAALVHQAEAGHSNPAFENSPMPSNPPQTTNQPIQAEFAAK
jgi:hypothetical protein